MSTSITLKTLGADHPKPHLHLPVHERIARKHRRNLVPAPPQLTTPKPEKQP